MGGIAMTCRRVLEADTESHVITTPAVTAKRPFPLKRPKYSARGSLTAECAGVLPLFFMACLTLMLFMNALKMQTAKNLELSYKARTLAIAAGCTSAGGIGTSGSEVAYIDLITTETYKHPFSLFGLKDVKVLCRARVYPWIGSNGIGEGVSENGEEGNGEIVYITENQSVYHTHADCTHLNLTVIRTTLGSVKNMRNADGKKYKKCSGFPKNYTGPVYVTPQGSYYYPSVDYGSLTRHVRVVSKSDYGNLKQCERCAARDAQAV